MRVNNVLCLLLLIWTLAVDSTVYRGHINFKTPPTRRQWNRRIENDLGGWMIRIVNSHGHFACGGAYIAPLMVITSGNCIEPFRNALVDVSAEGIAMMDNEDNFAFVETIYTPEQFKEHKNYMDIAVVRLRRPISGRKTEFIKLCDTEITPNMTLTALGWGYNSFAIQNPSIDPRNFTVVVQDVDECKKKFEKLRRVTISDTVFCVSHPTDRKKCVYDDGCPLIYKNQLCGIVSIDSTCIDPSRPGVYTNINKVKSFIKKIEDDIHSGIAR
ncbi:hypothetical protein KR044_010164 [Drosophila immigrans]|nr:hypothetical protein KR044_010164 [Drosophila immigrans]